MDEYFFNVDNGYLEGLVRGFRSGILSRGDYLNLVQCETVEGERSRAQNSSHEMSSLTAVVSACLDPLLSVRVYQCMSQVLSLHCVCSPDLKIQLQATDYGNFLQNEPSPIPVAIIDEKLRGHLVIEFQHIRNQSVPPLSTFLDYVTYVVCI